jgi:hypothetical protein
MHIKDEIVIQHGVWEKFFLLCALLAFFCLEMRSCWSHSLSSPSHVSVPWRICSNEIDIWGKMGFLFLLFPSPQKQRKPSQQVELVCLSVGNILRLVFSLLFDSLRPFVLLLPTLLVSSLTHHSNCSDCWWWLSIAKSYTNYFFLWELCRGWVTNGSWSCWEFVLQNIDENWFCSW